MKIKVYIAGPISLGSLPDNLNQARAAWRELQRAGFAPFLPHLTTFAENDESKAKPYDIPHDEWIAMALPWVAASDAVLRLPGESKGADEEVELAQSLSIPLYHSVDDLIKNPPVQGSEKFHGLLKIIGALHDKKQRDYGTETDPFHNIRASAEIGIEPWLGAWLRAKDKVRRIDRYCLARHLANESITDSLFDLAVYVLITKLLLDEK